MIWTPAASAQLDALWHAGHSTSEIGRRLGCSKNSVVSRARRNKLPARPSPIKAANPNYKPPVVRTAVSFIPALTSVASPERVPAVVIAQPAPVVHPVVAAQSPPPAPTPVRVSTQRCCWPVSGVGRATVWCEAASEVGRSYCVQHSLRAYRQPSVEAEAA